MTTATGRIDAPYASTDWTFGIQWRAVLAAALVGFGVTVILTTLGMAIGLTAADSNAGGKAVGIGAGIWWLLTVAVAGFASGRVLASTARRDIDYHPAILGTAAWALGVIILLFLLANGIGNVIGGLGGGMGAAAANSGALHRNVSPADSARVIQTAADVGKGAAWGLLISQVIGLAATIAGAGRRVKTVATTERGGGRGL